VVIGLGGTRVEWDMGWGNSGEGIKKPIPADQASIGVCNRLFRFCVARALWLGADLLYESLFHEYHFTSIICRVCVNAPAVRRYRYTPLDRFEASKLTS